MPTTDKDINAAVTSLADAIRDLGENESEERVRSRCLALIQVLDHKGIVERGTRHLGSRRGSS